MGETLFLSLLLLAQDPRERLIEAIREVHLEDAQAALAQLVAGDGARAARAMAVALPRIRERMATLLSASGRALEEFRNLDDSLTLELREREIKRKTREEAKARAKEACRRALEGEKIYAAILGSLGRLGPGAGPALGAEAERTASWRLKCELLEGMGALGARDLLRAAILREKEPVVLAAALEGAAGELGLGYLDHPQWQVRLGALRALGRQKEAVGPLIGRLSGADGRFRETAYGILGALTETSLPPDGAVWSDWWAANGEDFRAGRYNPARVQPKAGPGRTTFYDVPVSSTRVCFVIDRSGSMRLHGRFEAAKRELKRLLEVLPEGSRFNVLFFAGTVSSLTSVSRVLDPQARADAALFVERMGLESGTGTDLYGAVEKALACVGNAETGRLREEGLDTLLILSDGEPTVGRVLDEELLARVIARRARYLGPVIHTVSLSSDARSLRMLAELTGGECRVK